MKKFIIGLIVITSLLVFMAQGAFALDPGFKENIFERSAVVEAANCDGMFFAEGSSTYLYTEGTDSYWLTARHVVEGGSAIYVNGHSAYISKWGNGEENGDWALLKTYDYDPNLSTTPIIFSDDFNKNKEEGVYYDNLNKHRTITKAKVIEYGEDLIYTTTFAQLGNSGAGVFDDDGNLIGIVIERVKTEVNGQTIILLLTPDMTANL